MAVFETLKMHGRLGAGAAVTPIPTSEFKTAARRPVFSVLDKHDSWRAFDYTPPQWAHGVADSVRELINA